MQGSVTIPAASTGNAPAGHDEAMVARVDAGQAAAAAGLSTIPTPAAPAPAAATPAAASVAAPAAAPAEAPVVPPTGAEAGVLAKAGLTREGLATEFAESGDISEASYAKLAEQGISKEDFQQYLAGKQAQADTYVNSVLTATVGTAEKYSEVVNWAKGSLSPAEVAAFNAEVQSGDTTRATLAVAGLNARFVVANPAEPALLQEGNTPAASIQGYTSWAQVKVDMKDPRYSKDPAFRDQVKARLGASPVDLAR